MALALIGAGESRASSAEGLDQLTFTIRSLYDADGGCSKERVKSALIGVPTLVDVGGLPTPDLLVELVVVPAVPPVTDTTTVTLLVTKLASGQLPVLLEVILAPGGGASPERVAFGYDACASTAPTLFRSTVVSQPTRLSVDVGVTGPGSTLTLLGSAFSQVGGERVNPTAVSARLTPVPSTVMAIVDELGNGRYHADVTTSAPTTARVVYENKTDTASTVLHTTINEFPGAMGVTFSPTEVDYTASAPIRVVTVDVTSRSTGLWTNRVSARLTNLPLAASFRMDGESSARFEAQGRLGEATVRILSYEPGAALPPVAVRPDQYVVVERRDTFDAVDLRLRGVARAVARWDDPIAVDLDHRAGPFDLSVTTNDATTTVNVQDLPRTVQLNYSPESQLLTYSGSAEIGELTLDHLSEAPLFETATDLHVVARGVPVELSLSISEEQSSLTATMEGTLDLLEVQLTSGPDERLPAGAYGLMLVDRIDSYTLFTRVVGLESLTASWADPMRVDLVHAGSPFDVSVLTETVNDVGNVSASTKVARVRDLPPVADFEFSTSTQTLRYAGSDVIDRVEVDYQHAAQVDGRSVDAHLLALDLPTTLSLHVDFDAADAALSIRTCEQGPCENVLGLLEVQLTSGPNIRLPGGADGLLLEDRDDFDETPYEEEDDDAYVVFARMMDLRQFSYSKSTIHVGSPFDFDVVNTAVAARTLGGQPLVIDVKKANADKPDDVEYLRIDLDRLPDDVRLAIVENSLEPLDIHTQLLYTASQPAGSVTFATNGGDRTGLTGSLTPVPTVLRACVAPDSDFCRPEAEQEVLAVDEIAGILADGGWADVDVDQSFDFYVEHPDNRPIRFELYDACFKLPFDDLCVERPEDGLFGGTSLDLDLRIDRRFAVTTGGVRHNCPICPGVDVVLERGVVILDSDSGVTIDGEPAGVWGTIDKLNHLPQGADSLIDINLPDGFSADDRVALIECHIGACTAWNDGQMECPSGTAFEIDIDLLGIDLDFAEEICPDD